MNNIRIIDIRSSIGRNFQIIIFLVASRQLVLQNTKRQSLFQTESGRLTKKNLPLQKKEGCGGWRGSLGKVESLGKNGAPGSSGNSPKRVGSISTSQSLSPVTSQFPKSHFPVSFRRLLTTLNNFRRQFPLLPFHKEFLKEHAFFSQ